MTEAYTYDVVDHGDRTRTITLRQAATGKVKTFFLAGGQSISNLQNHMDSLTDSLCEQWFNERAPKKGKKGTTE